MHTKVDTSRFGGDLQRAAADQEQLDDIVSGMDRLVVATAVDGNVTAAPLHFVRDGQDLLFLSCRESRVVKQLSNNPLVQAVIWPCGEGEEYAAEVSGYCTEVKDAAGRRRAADLFRASRIKLPQRVLDNVATGSPANFACYRLRPRRTGVVGTLAIPRHAWRDYPRNEPADPVQVLLATGRWVKLWVQAVRAPFFTAALVPVLLGAAIARYAALRGDSGTSWSWALFFWVLVGAVLASAGTNLINDYGDYLSGADDGNVVGDNPFTGGSRMIQMGLLAPWKILAASVVCFGATIAIGFHINAILAGSAFAWSPLMAIGLIGCLLGVAYTVGPFPLSYKGLGEIAVAVGFGPVIVMGSSYVLTVANGATWPALASFLASMPVAIFILLVLWINQFQDAPADAAAGKRNWVVRIAEGGQETFHYESAFSAYRGLNLLGFVFIAILGAIGFANQDLSTPLVLFALLPLPLYFLAARRGRQWIARWNDPDEDRSQLPFALLGVNALSIGLHLATGLLLALAYVLPGWIWATP